MNFNLELDSLQTESKDINSSKRSLPQIHYQYNDMLRSINESQTESNFITNIILNLTFIEGESNSFKVELFSSTTIIAYSTSSPLCSEEQIV